MGSLSPREPLGPFVLRRWSNSLGCPLFFDRVGETGTNGARGMEDSIGGGYASRTHGDAETGGAAGGSRRVEVPPQG